MTTSTLVTVAFWRVLVEKVGRQAAQTAVPLLAVIAAGGGKIDVTTVGIGIGMQVAVVAGKAAIQGLVDLKATPDSALGWQLLDRCVPAFAGVYAGAWPITGQGFADFDLRAVTVAACAAAATAALTYFTNPPAFTGVAPAGVEEGGEHVA